jgi:hypothetical protein
MIFVMHVS